jgi:processive 1,2-diacylglycerol beta-glucosyltransferase
MRKRFEGSGRAFVEWLGQQPRFDAMVSTQPHGAGIGSIAKRDPRFAETYLAQIWTDFWYYGLYYAPRVDRYFAAAEEFAAAARTEHPDIRVTVSGVPIDPKFTVPVDASAVRRKFSLPEDGKPVVLIARGSLGYGAGFTLALLDQLARSGLPITIVANAGRNTALTARMREVLRRAQPGREPHALDWIDNMHELLAVTDVTVAKPGGLAVAEALARGVPFVGFAPIPGQEEANLQFLERHGAGRHALSPDAAVAAVRELVERPSVLSEVKARARAVGHPDAARVVARQILADI